MYEMQDDIIKKVNGLVDDEKAEKLLGV